MTVGLRSVLEGAAAGLGTSIDDLQRIILAAIGDGDATVIDDAIVEYVTEQFVSVTSFKTPSPSVFDALGGGTSSRPLQKKQQKVLSRVTIATMTVRISMVRLASTTNF
jgi:hypothetical protein